MLCPLCKIELKETILCNVAVHYCPKCLGLWFEENELRWAKDEKDKALNWLDIDLWSDKKKLRVASGKKLCPACRLLLYEVKYSGSKTRVDICKLCRGIWLDRGEFKTIINYIKQRADFEIFHNYAKNLLAEGFEVFVGPEKLREEIEDFLTLLKVLAYKFAAQHPVVPQFIARAMPK